MTKESGQRGPAATQVDQTGQNVRSNVLRLRKARGWTTQQLADELAATGRAIPQSGVSRIEAGARRVDVDDLAALAIVLRVSPSALLLPLSDDIGGTVEVSGVGAVSAADAWDWMDGKRPLKLTPGNERTEMLEYDLYSRPSGRRIHTPSPVRQASVTGSAPEQPAHGTDDSYPYGGDYEAGREYALTCYCGREFTGELDGTVERDYAEHISDVANGPA